MNDKQLVLSVIAVIIVCVIFLYALTPRYELTEVTIVKIHTVEDYKNQLDLGVKQATYPHIVYESVETKERFKDKTNSSMGEVGEVITINRQIGGMR